MRSLKETDEIIKGKYINATSIYSLAREKASMSSGEKVINAAIFLFTPFVRGVKTINALSDLGIYYLVEENNKQILVRVAKTDKEELIKEQDITGKFIGEEIIIDNERFKKIRHIQDRS